MYMSSIDLSEIQGFDWDQGNLDKNEKKHGVTWSECEEIFNNKPLVIVPDFLHSDVEKRYQAFGVTNNNKQLTLIVTLRGNYVRVISARLQNKKERQKYESITNLPR